MNNTIIIQTRGQVQPNIVQVFMYIFNCIPCTKANVSKALVKLQSYEQHACFVQTLVNLTQLSTRGTVDSDSWYLHLVKQPMV